MRVLVTGIFDLLHVEHVRFLAAAKAIGGLGMDESRRHFFDTLGSGEKSSSIVSKMPSSTHQKHVKLIVGIESDARVRKLKGEGRPVMTQGDRKETLEGLACVDEVFILPADFDNDLMYEKILRETKADVYAVSQNSPYLTNKKIICEKAGVKCVVVRKYNPEYSTTRLIEKVCRR